MTSTQRKSKHSISELHLDRAFADQLASSPDFQKWVLDQTKFKPYSNLALLLDKDQIAAKPHKKPENWWRHWWCTLEDSRGSETDIFAAFEVAAIDLRFALHIEDKPPHGRFTQNQGKNYRQRAKCMADRPEYMNYSDFTTILLAPREFLSSYSEEVKFFDETISYESVAHHVPLFGRALAEAGGA